MNSVESKNKYYKKLEKDWYFQKQNYSLKELIEIFPDAKEYLQDRSSSLKRIARNLKGVIRARLKLINKTTNDNFSYWFWREWVKVNQGHDLKVLEDEITRLERYLQPKSTNKNKISNNSLNKARNVPIDKVVGNVIKLKKVGDKKAGLCPFHNDTNPSLYIYSDTNTYYCYGCQERGDVIDFVQEFYGYSFPEAIEYLSAL